MALSGSRTSALFSSSKRRLTKSRGVVQHPSWYTFPWRGVASLDDAAHSALYVGWPFAVVGSLVVPHSFSALTPPPESTVPAQGLPQTPARYQVPVTGDDVTGDDVTGDDVVSSSGRHTARLFMDLAASNSQLPVRLVIGAVAIAIVNLLGAIKGDSEPHSTSLFSPSPTSQHPL
ncbi:hypothetical protein EDB86DRAFT_3086797 [Lactarius hatsudake]|nr:hypothetical protein EDB86DRAFT_3086797 [Lactarius hatsudake]